MFSASRLAAAPSGAVLKTERGKSTGSKFPPTASLSCFQADCDGHAASEGRRRLKVVLAHRRRGTIGRSAADPIAFKNALLFINPFSKRLLSQIGRVVAFGFPLCRLPHAARGRSSNWELGSTFQRWSVDSCRMLRWNLRRVGRWPELKNGIFCLFRSSYIHCSFGTSRALVASSRNAYRGWLRRRRAKASRCCSPGDSTSAQCISASSPPNRSGRFESLTALNTS